ncbi:amino acid ABC transporter permease [Rhizobium sp. P38BS-XIX]|uniref:amino acid ABC transporter permease n=1 Tax=Rhizobium sp. P38BS-XIX TaxID=2726740 RepID=UPI001457451A|nr:amino acid ABC transporter permease [Rhizobium sp. P38BS-XIX]NLS01623.1 amino acid ABC transporter permease [Rhizobium sp. P38BS-XIX]
MDYVFQFGAVFQRTDLIVSGLLMTIKLSVIATIAGFLLGVICARATREGSLVSRWLATTYVEIIRNTPFLAQLYMVAFGLPQMALWFGLHIRPSPYILASVALSINLGAYVTEIVRAGLDAIPKAQVEAAESLALTPFQIFLHVKLAPALAKVFPALTSQFVLQMLGSSVVSVIAVQELTAAAGRIQSETFRTFETYLVVTAIYFVLAFVLRSILSLVVRAIWPWMPRGARRSRA